MAQTLILTAPDKAVVGTTKWQVKRLVFDRGVRWDAATSAFVSDPERSEITIDLIGEGGLCRTEYISGATADALLNSLNKANMTSPNTLHKRVLDWIVANRPMPANTGVTGSPD